MKLSLFTDDMILYIVYKGKAMLRLVGGAEMWQLRTGRDSELWSSPLRSEETQTHIGLPIPDYRCQEEEFPYLAVKISRDSIWVSWKST